MTEGPGPGGRGRDGAPSPTRERILGAAVQVVAESGWSGTTVGGVAAAAGVSRQTVYNELGSKRGLAQALVQRELARFLDVVEGAFSRHPHDAVAAVRAAVRDVLGRAEDHPLVRSIVDPDAGADADLLPLLTTRAEPLQATATTLVADQLAAYETPLSRRELLILAEVLVRVVLSHLVRPSGSASEVAGDLARLMGRLLSAEPAPTGRGVS